MKKKSWVMCKNLELGHNPAAYQSFPHQVHSGWLQTPREHLEKETDGITDDKCRM